MERRKFLIGAGSAAVGASALVGSGAFTSVQANRTVTIGTADDSDAYLAFDQSNSVNEDYAGVNEDGTVFIDLDNNSVMGDGLNTESTTQINDIFKIKNQGTQAVVVYVDPSSIQNSNRTTSSGFGIDPQASNRPNGDYTNTSGVSGGVEDDQISLTGLYSDPPYEYSAYNEENDVDDATEEFVLEAGESFDFGLYVNTGGEITGNVSMEIVADATVVPDSYTSDGTTGNAQ